MTRPPPFTSFSLQTHGYFLLHPFRDVAHDLWQYNLLLSIPKIRIETRYATGVRQKLELAISSCGMIYHQFLGAE